MQDVKDNNVGRRDFLRAVGAGAGVAALAVAVLSAEASATETPKEAKKKRYNPNAPDVKNYYRVNRY